MREFFQRGQVSFFILRFTQLPGIQPDHKAEKRNKNNEQDPNLVGCHCCKNLFFHLKPPLNAGFELANIILL